MVYIGEYLGVHHYTPHYLEDAEKSTTPYASKGILEK